MSELQKKEDNRTDLVEKAWELYQKGWSYTSIGSEIGRHRNTVSEYVREYAESMNTGGVEFQRRASIAQLRKVIAHAWTLLEEGDIKDSSLTRPQLLHQIVQSVKEMDRITGLHVARVQVQHEHRTVADLIKSASEQGYLDVISGEEIVDADYEVIEDNIADTLS
jgi:hypothetical protein